MTWSVDADADINRRFVSKGALLSKIIKTALLGFLQQSKKVTWSVSGYCWNSTSLNHFIAIQKPYWSLFTDTNDLIVPISTNKK